ncbi:VTI1A protein, partial [Amia calva]|nr:VTI1A protein [Amia calva]
MSSDFETYEQDFGTLTADITNKIGRIPKLGGDGWVSHFSERVSNLEDEKKQMVVNVEKQFEEAKELMEQMDLEVREIPVQSRGMYNSRLKSYKQELEKLEKDFVSDALQTRQQTPVNKPIFIVRIFKYLSKGFPPPFSFYIANKKRSRIAYSDEVRNDLLGDDGNSSESQLIKLREERAHLLDNTERLERSSQRLEAGYQIAVETEQIGQEILENLHHDREKIQRSRDRLRETDANLGKSSRILTGMLRRIIQNRILMFVLGAIILFTIVLAIYFSVRRH